MPRPIRWLHLSDLHLGCPGASLWWEVQNEWQRHVCQMAATLGMPDLILITGDLTFSGTRKQFDLADRFLDTLLGWLRSAVAGPDPLIVPVPGNHDLKRPRAAAAARYLALEQMAEAGTSPVVQAVRDRMFAAKKPSAAPVRSLFTEYLAWFERRIVPAVSEHAKLTRSYFPGDISLEVVLDRAFTLGIVGLNATWAQYRDGDFEGRLWLAPEQLHHALPATGGSPLAALERWHRVLLLTHQPPGWLHPEAGKAFGEMIDRPGRFTAHLYGHLHEARSERTSLYGGPERTRFQSPSLFGVEHYGTAREKRHIGYTWGEIHFSGEIRLWPLARRRRGDGSFFFGWDDRFGPEEAAGVVACAGDAESEPTRPETGVAEDPAVGEYLRRAREQCRFVNMVGVTGGDCHFDLAQIHVALRLSGGFRDRQWHDEALAGEPCGDDRDVLVHEVFSRTTAGAPHVLVTGNPGSGKTTSLRKLQQECLTAPASLPGLAAGTVPVFVRLRHFAADDAEGTLASFVARALALQGEDAPALDLAERLGRGPALLLLDGLDEIADPVLRARFCGCLDRWLPAAPDRVRVVLSSRPAGLSATADPGPRFVALEARPLSDPEIADLVRRWFAEAARKLPEAGRHSEQRRDHLLAALRTSTYSTQAWKVLTGNPLLLTLLCLLTLRGHRMPDSRGEFYGKCLEVLLERHGEEVGEAPIGIPQAVPILRRLAFTLHRQRLAEVSMVRLVEIISAPLRAAGEPCPPLMLLDWLHRHAGVLESFGRHRFGFLHLGLQEYLTAAYLRDDGTAELQEIAGELDDPEDRWWHEPLLLLASLAGRQAASALLAALCQGSETALPGLAGECLAAMSDVDLAPLREIAADETAAEGRRQQARRFIAVHEPRPGLVRGDNQRLLLCHQPAHAGPALALAAALRSQGWSPWLAAEQVPPGHTWQDHLEQVLAAQAVAVLVGPGVPPWRDDDTAACLRTLAGQGRPLVLVHLPGLSDRPEPPAELPGTWVEAEASAITARLVAPQPATAETGKVLLDEVTGIRLLAIPGGTFRMGADDLAASRPVHEVCLSPFWLAETPVTNAQYGRFLAATGHREPGRWRDGRFSDPQQPVVAVSWRDAQEYCRWATEAAGRVCSLPSEAQWEYAARGEGSRTYPWGEDEPTPDHACFGLDYSSDKPAQVGSYPRGAGPFGTLDQAGLAWEWCRDHFEERAYRGRQGRITNDPVVEGGDSDERVLRGGCWFHPAQDLRAAIRYGNPAWLRNVDVGFRVAVARASP